MKRKVALLLTLLALCLAVPANAYEYSIDAETGPKYYPSTDYTVVYGVQYNYGGPNVSDYQATSLPYGVTSTTGIGAMEKFTRKITTGATVQYGLTSGGSQAVQALTYHPGAFTSTAGMALADGSIGTLTIPSLGITRKVWEGDFSTGAIKGLWHYPTSSGWDGNICLFGHNRGTKLAIGSIKDMNIGDLITYTTVYGTQTYEVTYVGTIAYTDWSRLQTTADNRITLTTCLADHPESRVCVQAIEKILEGQIRL